MFGWIWCQESCGQRERERKKVKEKERGVVSRDRGGGGGGGRERGRKERNTTTPAPELYHSSDATFYSSHDKRPHSGGTCSLHSGGSLLHTRDARPVHERLQWRMANAYRTGGE